MFVLSAFLLLGSALAQTANNDSSSACASAGGIHIIVARASLEPAGYGTIGTVKDSVISRIPGSNAEAVAYPATLDDYENSETAGVIADRALINAYISNCNGPFVLMGYSQGAQVSLDSIVGQVDSGFSDNTTVDQPLSSDILSRLAAVIVMGDPTFVANESFHVGNATKNGDFPRGDVDRFDSLGLSSRIQSYCDDGDLFCAGGTSLAVHVGYVAEYGSQAADFVVSQVSSYYGSATGVATGAASTAKPSASRKVSSGRASASASASGRVPSASASASPTAAPSASSTPSSQTAATSAPASGDAQALSVNLLGLGAVFVAALL